MQLSEAEWKLMNVLWERHPSGAREVLECVGDQTGWAYTTVKTMLTRLVEKRALQEERQGNRSLYRPLVSRSEARHQAVRSLLDRAFGGTFGSLVHHLVDEERLSAKDRRELLELLEDRKKPR